MKFVLSALSTAMLFVAQFSALAFAAEREGNYLYHVTTVRAAPGELKNVLEWRERLVASNYFEDAGDEPNMIMRHSQGDHWDLMVIAPMGSWTDYYEADATERRTAARQKHAELIAEIAPMIAFSEDHFAFGPPLRVIREAWDANSFLHVEMFAAAPGKATELLEQRRMENNYLAATGQVENMIFRRAGGSDIDVFTIGFHRSFAAFAAPAPVTDEEKEVAATEAGFGGLADLSFYLRSLLAYHHDTLANKVE